MSSGIINPQERERERGATILTATTIFTATRSATMGNSKTFIII